MTEESLWIFDIKHSSIFKQRRLARIKTTYIFAVRIHPAFLRWVQVWIKAYGSRDRGSHTYSGVL